MTSRDRPQTDDSPPAAGVPVLISGAGVAGLTAAYWLAEGGFHPILIERSPDLLARGHAVDLWGSAVEILSHMGIEEHVSAKALHNRTGITMTDRHRSVTDLDRLSSHIHPRHIEVMRPHLISCLADALGDRATWLFGRQIRRVEQKADMIRVMLDDGASLSGACLVGADGVDSAVRALAFDVADRAERPLGITLGVWTGPAPQTLGTGISRYVAPGRTLAAFRLEEGGKASIITLIRTGNGSHDADPRAAILRSFAAAPEPVAALAASACGAGDFHGGAVRSVEMHRWHRGRVALVGDAGFAPGAAVGGGTGLAVLTAYCLAKELRAAPVRDALARYTQGVAGLADAAAGIGPAMAKSLVPSSRAAAWAAVALPPLLTRLPPRLRRHIPILPRAARKGLRAIAYHPAGDLK